MFDAIGAEQLSVALTIIGNAENRMLMVRKKAEMSAWEIVLIITENSFNFLK